MVGPTAQGWFPNAELTEIVKKTFDLRPAAIIERLDLLRPIYRKTTNYGHFGRELPEFAWEKTDMVEDLKRAVKIVHRLWRDPGLLRMHESSDDEEASSD